MTTDISFINDNLPSSEEVTQLLKEQLETLNTKEYIFTFATTVPNPQKAPKLGIAKKIDSAPKKEYLKEYKEYIKGSVSWAIEGLALGIINQCEENNKKEVTIVLPGLSGETSFLSTYMEEDKVILAGFVRIYFND